MVINQKWPWVGLGLITVWGWGSMLEGALAEALPRAARQDAPFMALWGRLQRYGFTLKLQRPPRANTYGLLEGRTKTIWINPVVFELGNARPVLAHEAVHGAQYCAGGGRTIQPLGVPIAPSKQLRPFYVRYHRYRRQLEAEAYTVQIQPNRIEIAIALLDQHCS